MRRRPSWCEFFRNLCCYNTRHNDTQRNQQHAPSQPTEFSAASTEYAKPPNSIGGPARERTHGMNIHHRCTRFGNLTPNHLPSNDPGCNREYRVFFHYTDESKLEYLQSPDLPHDEISVASDPISSAEYAIKHKSPALFLLCVDSKKALPMTGGRKTWFTVRKSLIDGERAFVARLTGDILSKLYQDKPDALKEIDRTLCNRHRSAYSAFTAYSNDPKEQTSDARIHLENNHDLKFPDKLFTSRNNHVCRSGKNNGFLRSRSG